MYIFICVTRCVVPVLIYAITGSAAVSHPRAAVPHLAVTGKLVVCELSFASRFIYMTQYATPYRSMDVRGAPSLSLKCESWLLMPIWEFNSLFSYLGGGSTSLAQKSQLYFISFVSHNWVVINHQKGRDWKCNQVLIIGFSDNDHTIRGLMRFIKITSSEYIIEDAIWNGGAPIYKYLWLQTQRRFKFFYILNLIIGKAVL